MQKQKTDSHFLVTIRFYLPLFPWLCWWRRFIFPVLKMKTQFVFEHAAGVTADNGAAQKSPVWADVGG
ncbi:MAG: hypothetical protein IIU57_04235, partial [Oscillospiraceae bacterium]|nr:hypothetical protein [Oscillospiraceae bacterium]